MKAEKLKAEELLISARREVEKGWVQGKYETRKGVCAMGALRNASRRAWSPEWAMAYAALHNAVPAAPQPWLGGFSIAPCVVDFNDTEGRTKEEVLALFDRALASLYCYADPAHDGALVA